MRVRGRDFESVNARRVERLSRYRATPKLAKPRSDMTQVEGSGTTPPASKSCSAAGIEFTIDGVFDE